MVSPIKLPPNALRLFGRLNYSRVKSCTFERICSTQGVDLDDANLTDDLEYDVVIFIFTHFDS